MPAKRKPKPRKLSPRARALAWEHIYELGEKHQIKVHKAAKWTLAEAHVGTRQVWVPPRMDDAVAYLIALHELGHIVSDISREFCKAAREAHVSAVIGEAAAWAWAVQTAKREIIGKRPPLKWFHYIGQLWGSHVMLLYKQGA